MKNYLHRTAIEFRVSLHSKRFRSSSLAKAETRAEKIKEGGRKVSFFSPNLVPRVLSYSERILGTRLLPPSPSPYLPLLFVLLLLLFWFLFFFSLAPSFRAITRMVTVPTRAHLELESFVTGRPHKLS